MSNFENLGAGSAHHASPRPSRRIPTGGGTSGTAGRTDLWNGRSRIARCGSSPEASAYLTLLADGRVGDLREGSHVLRRGEGKRAWRQRQRNLERVFWAERFLGLERTQREGKSQPHPRRVSRSSRGLRRAIDLIVQAHEAARLVGSSHGGPGRRPVPRVGTPIPADASLRRPCARALLSWVHAYERADPVVPNDRVCAGLQVTRADLEVEAIMAHVVAGYASVTRPTKSALYLSLKERLMTRNASLPPEAPRLKLPRWQTFSRCVAALDQLGVGVARRGEIGMRSKYGPQAFGIVAPRVGEVVRIGKRQISLRGPLVATGLWERMSKGQRDEALAARPWVCEAVDVASRAVLGMAVTTTEPSDVAVECMRMMMSDKGFHSDAGGALSRWSQCVYPKSLLTEAGSDVLSDDARDIVAGLGISVIVEPDERRIPWGIIEGLSGAADTSVRRHGAPHVLPETTDEPGCAPDARATLDGLCVVLVRHVVDRYQNSPHAALGGETPAAAFERLTDVYGRSSLPSPTTMAMMFGP